MEILTNYYNKNANYKPFISDTPSKDIQNVIVIPAIGEPDLIKTIESIWNCTKPDKPVEIIVVINSSENSGSTTVEINKENLEIIKNWGTKYNTYSLKVFGINIQNIKNKDAGAGYARKTGMDEAIQRYIKAEKDFGIISSLDADASVSANYLVEIEKLFNRNKKCNACSIYFEHPTEGNVYSDKVYKAITEYELHLRYFKQMLFYIGFPYYHHTVGSSFAVSAKSYCKQGGMNKKKAGEDFYFLHKLMPLGNYYELNATCVFPSPRPSDRVPFGTGATIMQYLNQTDKEYLTYNLKSFLPIKRLFCEKDIFFNSDSEKIEKMVSKYENVLREFLLKNDFISAIEEINSNTSSLISFQKRFFNWFDAFRIIKYLNNSHQSYFDKQKISEAVLEYMEISKISYSSKNINVMLDMLRQKERNVKVF